MRPLRPLLQKPWRVGIGIAIAVTLLLAFVSFPREEQIEKQITGWQTGGLGPLADAPALLERFAHAGPWWSPQRYVYKAVAAEIDAAGDVLTMTYKRDLDGLVWLLLLDLGLSAIYGIVAGMIVAVLRGAGIDRQKEKPPVQPAPVDRSAFRA